VNTDELLAQMQREDLEGATRLTPVRYGKLRGISPQLVYYHIRAKHIDLFVCDCGSKVIDVKAADEFFKKGDAGEEDETPTKS
jgi:hypothetical protein